MSRKNSGLRRTKRQKQRPPVLSSVPLSYKDHLRVQQVLSRKNAICVIIDLFKNAICVSVSKRMALDEKKDI